MIHLNICGGVSGDEDVAKAVKASAFLVAIQRGAAAGYGDTSARRFHEQGFAFGIVRDGQKARRKRNGMGEGSSIKRTRRPMLLLVSTRFRRASAMRISLKTRGLMRVGATERNTPQHTCPSD